MRLDVQYEVHSLGALFLFGGQLGRLLCLCLLVRRRRRAAPDAEMPLPSWLLAGHARRLVLLKVAIGLGAAAMVASGIADNPHTVHHDRRWSSRQGLRMAASNPREHAVRLGSGTGAS